jgi:DNA-binding transcriptional LysR family regulator
MQLRKVDLNLLVVLDVLLRERSVTKAAAQLFLSQSAMSHALNRLRTLLDDPLLVRGPGGLALTPRAEELREPVHQALLAAEAVVGHGGFDPARSTRLFTLGTTDYFDSLLLPRLTETLRAEAPGVRVLLRNVVKEFMVDDLSRGNIDLAISFVPKIAVHAKPLLTDTYSCVVRSRGRGGLTLQDYLERGHVLVSPSGTFSGTVDDELARRGMARKVVMSTPRYLSAAEIVARSDLILTVQSRLARKFVEYLPVRVLDLPVAMPSPSLTMQWSGRTHGDPANMWLRSRIAAIEAD